ncbi:MAG: type III polyketide synthase [Bacteroidota bacterium]
MSYITAIGTANPRHRFSQETIADFMLKTMQFNNGESRKLKTIFKASGIDYRYSVLEDYGKLSNFTFYPEPDETETFPSTVDRLKIFRQNALALSVASVHELMNSSSHVVPKDITHLIVVCCTGMYAPGLDIDLVRELNLSSSVQRTCITFMGCYAAFNALKVADAFCHHDPKAKVLIVCTELCSLHFQRTATDDNILANALFADGSASVLVESQTDKPLKLALENFHSDLAVNGAQDMAWTVGDLGFEMKLSAYVPDIIRGGIATLANSLLAKISKKLSDIRHFAIHPGGKKILEVIESELGITKDQNRAAYDVLKNYGNMSSPTILFVLKEIIGKLKTENRGERILSFAFGPGLTLESMVLKIEIS